MRNIIQGTSLLAGCAFIAMAAPAQAQQASQADTDASNAEIVVTAQNRSQKINDVPIAINVISGDELNKVGFSIRLAVKY